MGWGDEIIATGQARIAQQHSDLPVVVFDRYGHPRAHEMWAFNPRIHTTWDKRMSIHRINNGPSLRPYIATKTIDKWGWKDYACPPGEIYFNAAEIAQCPPVTPDMILLEPNIKSRAPVNKDWGWDRWQALADMMLRAGLRPVQFGTYNTKTLTGVPLLHTNTFRLACAGLARCRAAVLPEGGLHHAAAALNVRAVVLYGGFISPKQTGYVIHKNLFTGHEPCGMRVPCKHCALAMAAIEPEMVLRYLEGILNA